MPQHQFNVIFKQTVEREVNRVIDADTEAQALELAKMAMKNGEGVSEVIVGETVDRNMMIDEEVDNEMLRIGDVHSRLPGQ